jgi:hypothetical protein
MALCADDIDGRYFRFERVDGSLISRLVRLATGGAVIGSIHPNETSWRVDGDGVLEFLDAGGRVTTRFTDVATDSGRLVLTGPFLPWDAEKPLHRIREIRSDPPALKDADGQAGDLPVTPETLRGVTFVLKDAFNQVVSPNVYFLSDGRVMGTRDPRHETWVVEGGWLVIRGIGGQSFRRFGMGWLADGTVCLVGNRRLPEEERYYLIAEAPAAFEVPPTALARRQAAGGRALVLVRTHLMNAKVVSLVRALEATATNYDVALVVDETNGRPPVEHERIVWHSVAACAELGLALPAQRPLWWCGDAPLYFAIRQYPDYSYYFMIEYDVHLTAGDGRIFNTLTERLLTSHRALDCVGMRFRAGGMRQDLILQAAFRKNPEVHSFFLPVLGASRKAISYLYQERMIEALRHTPDEDILYCEAFVPMTLLAGGFSVGDLNEVAPGCYTDRLMIVPSRFSSLPLSLAGGFEDHVAMIHQVYDDAEFLDRMIRWKDERPWLEYVLKVLDDRALAVLPDALRQAAAARVRAMLEARVD